MYHVNIELTKKPRTSIQVYYNQPLDRPLAPFFVIEMYHHVEIPDDGFIATNMCHLVMDVMTTGYFAPLRVQIEHEIEISRRVREKEGNHV